MKVECDYCGKPARLVRGSDIYPHRKDLRFLQFWVCWPCDARVGCHSGTTAPLGRLANRELRKAKMAAHAAFDPLWKQEHLTRSEAYEWLSSALGLPKEETHIGMFDVDTCKEVVELAGTKMIELENERCDT